MINKKQQTSINISCCTFESSIDQDEHFRIISDKYNLFLFDIHIFMNEKYFIWNVKYKDTRFFKNSYFMSILQRNILYFI